MALLVAIVLFPRSANMIVEPLIETKPEQMRRNTDVPKGEAIYSAGRRTR
jgi:hypothetical protein